MTSQSEERKDATILTFSASLCLIFFAPEGKRGKEEVLGGGSTERGRFKEERARGGGVITEESRAVRFQRGQKRIHLSRNYRLLKMDLSFLQVLERERVLEVLHRDKHLRKIEEERIR